MWLGCAQYGGVVSMRDGAVAFKGGTITNTKATAVRTGHDARWHSCTGCRNVASSALGGVRRTLDGDAALDVSFPAMRCTPRAACPISTCDRSHVARCLSLPTLCCIASLVLLCGWYCLVHRFVAHRWVRIQ